MFSRLHIKLTLLFVSLFIFVQALIGAVFYNSAQQNVRQQTIEQLSRSARTFDRILAERRGELLSQSQSLALDFGFRKAISEAHKPTVISALNNAASRYGFSVSAVLSNELNTLGEIGLNPQEMELLSDALKSHLDSTKGGFVFSLAFGGNLYDFGVVPIKAPDAIGWLLIGSPLGDTQTFEIKALSALDANIGILMREKGATYWEVITATDAENELETYFHLLPQDTSFPATVKLSGTDYLLWLNPLGGQASNKQFAVILYYSFDTVFALHRNLFYTLALVSVVGILVLVISAYFVAQGVSKPITLLAHAAEKIADGQYDDLEIAGDNVKGEIRALTKGFSHMLAAVKDREEHITYQAHHDMETGLPNRLCFEQNLEKCVELGEPFHIVAAQLINLSVLRGVFDADHMSMLFSAVAGRLSDLSGRPVAHLSQGLFALKVPVEIDVGLWADRAIREFEHPVQVGDIAVDARLSIGIVAFPGDGESAGVLIRRAAAALDQTSGGSTTVSHFDAYKNTAKMGNLSIMSDMRRGIENGEVTFAYQPKLDLASGEVKDVEALVRWNSPERGFVPPDEFIPIAEQTGEIRHLTEWGIREVAKQVVRWRQSGLGLRIGMNLSSSDLMNRGLPGFIESVLQSHGLTGKDLYLEVTESDVMADIERATEVMRALHALGIELAVDDYGTGHSSLRYLKRLPLNEMKIDKDFVLRLAYSEEDKILVRSTIELGHNLGLRVTAEGVEDQTAMDLLRQFGCDHLQGFYIARPLPAKEIPAAVRRVSLMDA